MDNMIEEYKNAISDEVVDAMRDFFDTAKEFQTYGEVGTGQIDRQIKDSMDLNILDKYEGDGSEIVDKSNYIHSVILPKLSKQLDEALVKYLRKHTPDHHTVLALEKSDEELLKEFYIKYSFWPMSILMKHYKVEGKQGYHRWHEDNGDDPTQSFRSYVLMFYLADVEEGGETEFYNQNVKIKPEKGKLVIFPPFWTHLHRGNVPISNDKYICNFWILKGGMDLKPTIGGKWNIKTDYFPQ